MSCCSNSAYKLLHDDMDCWTFQMITQYLACSMRREHELVKALFSAGISERSAR